MCTGGHSLISIRFGYFIYLSGQLWKIYSQARKIDLNSSTGNLSPSPQQDLNK